MEFLVKIMSKLFPDFSIQWLVDETKINIFKELDFYVEGKNAEKVADMFKHYTWLKVPKVYWEYTTDRVLVMEYVDGGQVNDLNYVKVKKYLYLLNHIHHHIYKLTFVSTNFRNIILMLLVYARS